MTVLLLAALVFGAIAPALVPVPALAQDIGTATVTDALNLRSGPSLSDRVLAVIPAGGKVQLTGQTQNGFRSVTYNGTAGWAFETYLAIDRAAASPSATAVTTDALNLRSGPGTSNAVLIVMPRGATVTLTGQTQNGFRSLTYSGYSGWASSEYLRVTSQTPTAPSPPPPPPATDGTATTTAALNLRSGAGLGFTVIAVMPQGANVSLTGRSANGFREVTWNGRTGWASAEYLRVTTAPPANPAPQPPPPPPTTPPPASPAGTAVTTAALNLRSGAGTSFSVILVMPAQAKVALTGRSQNSFLELSYNGRTGWAHRDYLVVEGAAPTPSTGARATDDLNLRSGPATSYTIRTVIPNGARVALTGQVSNGFHGVTYNGITGWAFSTYLAIDAPSPPPPTTTPPVTEAPFDGSNTIIGPVRGDVETAMDFARRSGAKRIDEVQRYVEEIYRLAPTVGFDPAILVAQSAHETGNWTSSWWNERLNPAGLGITGDPAQEAASTTFASGTIGARAQIAHMHAEVYGRSQALPTILQGVDATYQHVFDAGWAGTIRTIEDLTGKWAVDPEYHLKIVRKATLIFG